MPTKKKPERILRFPISNTLNRIWFFIPAAAHLNPEQGIGPNRTPKRFRNLINKKKEKKKETKGPQTQQMNPIGRTRPK